MILGKGKHRAGPENGRLRQARRDDREYIGWCHERFAELGHQVRSFRARAEVAEGRLLASEQLVHRQVGQLMERDARIGELERLIRVSGEDTVQTPIPQLAEPELAGVAS